MQTYKELNYFLVEISSFQKNPSRVTYCSSVEWNVQNPDVMVIIKGLDNRSNNDTVLL
jgi:hypothetical protein